MSKPFSIKRAFWSLALNNLAIASILVVLCFSGLSQVIETSRQSYESRTIPLGALTEAIDSIHQARALALTAVSEEDPDRALEVMKGIEIQDARASKALEHYRTHANPDAARRLEAFLGQWEGYRKVRDMALAQIHVGDIPSAFFALKNRASPLMGEVQETLEKMVAKEIDGTRADFESSADAADRRILYLVSAAVAGFLAMGGMLFLTARRVVSEVGGEISDVQRIVSAVSEGDMAASVSAVSAHKNSLLDHVVKMSSWLREVVLGIRRSSDALSKTASGLKRAIDVLEQNSAQQNESAGSIASAVEEMSVSITSAAATAHEVSERAQLAMGVMNGGACAVSDLVSDMAVLRSVTGEAVKTVDTLNARSDEIDSIVRAIQEVAEQINLLALNAAIEAARAGESGRGFAVVADEVRKLSERTRSSTQSIAAVLDQIHRDAKAASASMTASVEQMDKGAARADVAQKQLGEAVVKVTGIMQSMQDIADALKEQATGSAEIAGNVERIAVMTAENLEGVHQVHRYADQVQQESIEVQSLVMKFKI